MDVWSWCLSTLPPGGCSGEGSGRAKEPRAGTGTCKGRIPKVALARRVLPLGDNVQRDFFPSFGTIGKVLAKFGPCDGVWMQHWGTMLHGGSRSCVPAPAPPELQAARAGDSGFSEEALDPMLQEKFFLENSS